MQLTHKLTVDKATMLSPNLASQFPQEDLDAIGGWVFEGYSRDLQSRSKWELRTQAAMDLALQLQQAKTFPWPGASNVKFPLVTIATLQFHSRAYPAIVNGPEIVRYRVGGEDPGGEQKARALRVGAHMSYQLLEEDEDWEEQHDRLLINLPIVGCAFKKSYHDASAQINESELVLAKDLVLDYYAKSVEGCGRKTHIVPMYKNELYERMVLGTFLDCREEAWFQGDASPALRPNDARKDQRDGQNPPQTDSTTPYTTLEQHCWYDFDCDGYAEPYIITIEATTQKVLRIVARWDREIDVSRTTKGEIFRITATEYFTKYSFIPAPDGSIYDIGFGILLGPLNESVNTLVNQLIDAGTMATTAGGFLARGAKLRGGTQTFAPLEWKRVDATGDDLKKSILPLPVREPSAVLFQLLSLLISYTDRVSGSTDIMVGENVGQNTPAATSQELVRQGSKIYTAIFKRVWRSMKEECKKLYKLNAVYLPTVTSFGPEGTKALREDYKGDPNRIIPSADPAVTSDEEQMRQAVALKQAAMTTPGYDPVAVERNYLRALKIDSPETYYPGPDKVPAGKDPKIALQELKNAAEAAKLKQDQMQFLIATMEEQRVNTATIENLRAQSAKYLAEVRGAEAGQQIAAFDSALGALKSHDEALRARIELMMKSMESGNGTSKPGEGRLPELAAAPGNPSLAPTASAGSAGLEGAMG